MAGAAIADIDARIGEMRAPGDGRVQQLAIHTVGIVERVPSLTAMR